MRLFVRLLIQPTFTKKQVEQLSNTFNNAGQVILGGMIITPIVNGFDKEIIPVLILGVVLMMVCWITSLLLLKK